jgi:hypothetical protein
MALSASPPKPSTDPGTRGQDLDQTTILRVSRYFGTRTYRPEKLFRLAHETAHSTKSLKNLLVIQSLESVILSHMTYSMRNSLLLLLGLLLSQRPVVAQLPVIGRSPTVPVSPSGSGIPASQEEWYRIEFDGQNIGHESVSTTFLSGSGSGQNGPRMLRRIRETRLKLRRFGQDLSVSAHLESVESSDGLLQSWSLRRTAADSSHLERTGSWSQEKSAFEITERIRGTEHRQLLSSNVQPRSALFPGWLSEASHDNDRLWTSAVLFPETSAIVDIEIRRAGEQSLLLPSGKTVAITRFDYWPTSNPEMKSSVFYDAHKSVVRIEQPLLGQTLRLERTDAAGALGQESMQAMDLEFRSVLPLKRPLANIERSPSLRLKIAVNSGEQISLPSSDFQTIDQSVSNELLVTLSRPVMTEASDNSTSSGLRKPVIDSVYTQASRWISTDDEDVRRMGIIAAGGTSIPLDKCKRLTRHVWKHMRVSPFSTSLIPASRVIRDMRGDCTEHAVLLSTLMRCQGIPSRVAVGFVYVPNPASFAPHMWTEAFLDGKWIPFDSTRGPDGIGLTHIKLADSALPDDVGSGTVLFVPLLSFLGRATVDVAPQPQ